MVSAHFLPFYFFTFLLFYLFTFSLFPYKATKCPEQFVGHAAGIVLHVESRARVYRSEVRAVGAVVLTRNGNVLAHVDARIALADGWCQTLFTEREMLVVEEIVNLHVAAQHAQVALTCLHAQVVAEHRLQVYTDLCVQVPTYTVGF